MAAAPITGKWLTTERDSIIEIAPCASGLCGTILRVLKVGPAGQTTDSNNPVVALRTRPLVGIVILTGFADSGSDWRGRIYDPRSGRSYKSIVSHNPDGTLKVQGCIGFICRTLVWTAARNRP